MLAEEYEIMSVFKKMTCFILVLLLCAGGAVFAAESATFTLSTMECSMYSVAQIDVVLSDADPLNVVIIYNITYDENVLSLIDAEWVEKRANDFNYNESSDPLDKNLMFKEMGDSDIDVNGRIATIRFLVVGDPGDSSDVSFSVGLLNHDGNPAASVVHSKVTVTSSSSEHGNMILTPAKPATCFTDGNNAYFTCPHCGKIFKADGITETTVEAEVIKADHFYGELIPERPAAKSEGGLKAHYQCYVCNKIFDENKVETTLDDLVINASADHVHAPDMSVWQSDAYSHWNECACGEKSDISYHTWQTVTDIAPTQTEEGGEHEECAVCHYSKPAVTIPKLDHTHAVTFAASTPSSCNEAGTVDHWHCDKCGRNFADEAAENILDSIASPLLPHTPGDYIAEIPADHNNLGSKGYYICSVCGTKLDSNGRELTKMDLDSLILPTIPHEYSYESDGSGHWLACSCGDATEKEEHNFDWTVAAENGVNAKTGICSVCGYETEADVIVDEAAAENQQETQPEQKNSLPIVPILLVAGATVIVSVILISQKRK